MVKSAESADLVAAAEPAEPFRFPAARRAPPLTARVSHRMAPVFASSATMFPSDAG